jgi:exopolyphosphatase / guanosine-5'-triphosphate,3'-diphosphate pyrophosphatase
MQLAAIDLGSNSFRLQLGRAEGDHVEPQGYWKETVRLAGGINGDGKLTPKSMQAALECLARMNERLRGLPQAQVRAVGTETLRNLRNLDEFLLEGQEALGYPIDVISGREEARLTFEGCMHTLPSTRSNRLVVDIGGASTELIIGRGFAPSQAESFKVGCVNTTLSYFADQKLTRTAFREAQIDAASQIEEATSRFDSRNWTEAYGSSGTVAAIAQALRALEWGTGSVTPQGLEQLRQMLIEAGDIRRIRVPAVKPERLQVLAGGLAVLAAVFETLGVAEMTPARGGLRLGLLYALLGRRASRDPRDSTVDRLQKRFDVDREQASRVSKLASELFAAIAPDADDESIKRLAWGAALHEVGFAISHTDYHKHSAYLVENGDLPGFSTTDQERIATLILGQRGNLRKVADALANPRRAGKILALRLAVIFNHARKVIELPAWSLRESRGGFELRLPAEWLRRHPLTGHLLREESEQWDRVSQRFVVRSD